MSEILDPHFVPAPFESLLWFSLPPFDFFFYSLLAGLGSESSPTHRFFFFKDFRLE